MSKPPKRGRPALPACERRTRHVRVPVDRAEGAAFDAWAAREGRPLAELVRAAALARAKRTRQ